MRSLYESLEDDRAGDPELFRHHQREAVRAIAAGFGDNRTQLVVMATGLGKTQTFCVVARDWADGDILILAHRDELIDQLRSATRRCSAASWTSRRGVSRLHPLPDVVVASVQSLYKKRREKMSRQRFGLIIIDEAHRATAKSYREIIEYFDQAKVLGVTATPDRTDEKAMGQVFENVPFVMDIEDGIEAGYLDPIDGKKEVAEDRHLERLHNRGRFRGQGAWTRRW